MSPSFCRVARTDAYSRTTGIDTLASEKHLVSETRSPRLIIDLEAIYHVLEMDIF
jgi:hypothetical protein